jgi:hypothetical protein
MTRLRTKDVLGALPTGWVTVERERVIADSSRRSIRATLVSELRRSLWREREASRAACDP